jgi:hypothetical protein
MDFRSPGSNGQLDRPGSETITTPDKSLRVQAEDDVVIVSRDGQAARTMFAAPAEKSRVGK